ncbi:hypothetical protein NEOKW01_1825 [Nematocida sp. AWRm80]|nr:hypothetical protein NEOKW01_1825 [Nematocida sp. AWRm80]
MKEEQEDQSHKEQNAQAFEDITDSVLNLFQKLETGPEAEEFEVDAYKSVNSIYCFNEILRSDREFNEATIAPIAARMALQCASTEMLSKIRKNIQENDITIEKNKKAIEWALNNPLGLWSGYPLNPVSLYTTITKLSNIPIEFKEGFNNPSNISLKANLNIPDKLARFVPEIVSNKNAFLLGEKIKIDHWSKIYTVIDQQKDKAKKAKLLWFLEHISYLEQQEQFKSQIRQKISDIYNRNQIDITEYKEHLYEHNIDDIQYHMKDLSIQEYVEKLGSEEPYNSVDLVTPPPNYQSKIPIGNVSYLNRLLAVDIYLNLLWSDNVLKSQKFFISTANKYRMLLSEDNAIVDITTDSICKSIDKYIEVLKHFKGNRHYMNPDKDEMFKTTLYVTNASFTRASRIASKYLDGLMNKMLENNEDMDLTLPHEKNPKMVGRKMARISMANNAIAILQKNPGMRLDGPQDKIQTAQLTEKNTQPNHDIIHKLMQNDIFYDRLPAEEIARFDIENNRQPRIAEKQTFLTMKSPSNMMLMGLIVSVSIIFIVLFIFKGQLLPNTIVAV